MNLTTFSSETIVQDGMRRLVEYSYPDDSFWREWRNANDSLKSMGFAVTKNENGRYIVVRYRNLPDKVPAPQAVIYQLSPAAIHFSKNYSLLPYQIPSAGQLCAALLKHGVALDASDTGTGKTAVALSICKELRLRPAIICPKSSIGTWETWCKIFGIIPIFIANWEACKSLKFRFGALKVDGSYEWNLAGQAMLIFDEAHKAKGEYTINSKMVVAAKRAGVKTMLLSATIASNPREMKAMGFLLGLHKLYDFNTWSVSLGCYQNKFEGWECTDKQEAMAKISGDIFPAKGSRIRISELGDAFPDSQISADVYEIGKYTSAQNSDWDELLAEIAKLQEAKKAGVQAAILALNLRYRQVTEGYKVELLREMAEDYIENGLSVAIFVNFTATLISLQEKLTCPVVYGEQDAEEREAAIAKFQNDKARCIILNIKAGGVGLSLHDLYGRHPRVSLICPTYSPIDLKQSLGRVHRAGGKSKSLQRLIYAKGTVEEEICKTVAGKLSSMSALNDGDLMEHDILKILGKE